MDPCPSLRPLLSAPLWGHCAGLQLLEHKGLVRVQYERCLSALLKLLPKTLVSLWPVLLLQRDGEQMGDMTPLP